MTNLFYSKKNDLAVLDYTRTDKIILLLFFFITNTTFAQTYFQQQVNYTIHVSLNDREHFLNAYEEIEYINHSPDTFTYLYFHLWPNAYKNNKTALAKQMLVHGETDFHYSSKNDKGYIDSLKFIHNNSVLSWDYDPQYIDICKVKLNTPLKSGEQIKLTIPFRIKLPSAEFSRLGHICQAYYISQWYPKPAVYDRLGWHPIPYLNQGEFYSEFGNYDVYITLPKNYVVGATGDLPENHPELEWLSRKSAETYARIEFDTSLSFPRSDTALKTLHYTQKNVHDFAWFADKRFHVLKGETELPNTHRKIITWALFTNKGAEHWKKSNVYLNDAIEHYSKHVGDYPFNQVTAVDGTIAAGGGMEYPTITIINTPVSDFELDLVIAHEVGHNWFYGILGSNERDHPWMDEGLNSYYEKKYISAKYPGTSILNLFGLRNLNILGLRDLKYTDQYYLSYLATARANTDQSISLPSVKFGKANYATIVYAKSAEAFTYLENYLGTDVFDSCMKQYYEQWKFRHPYPDDFKKIFAQKTKQDLNWFFNGVFSEQKLDYKICRLKKKKNSYQLKIKNNGQIVSPVGLTLTFNNDSVYTTWVDGFKGKKTIEFKHADLKQISIDQNKSMPEINRRNNQLRSGGLFKRIEPLQIKMIGAVENPKKTQLFWMPVIGYNYYSGLIPGIVFYNRLMPEKDWEYILMPMYSVSTNRFFGIISLKKNFNFSKSERVIFKANLSSFDYNYNTFYNRYIRICPSIEFPIKDHISKTEHLVSWRTIFLFNESTLYFGNKVKDKYYTEYTYNIISEMSYHFENNRKINPIIANIKYQQGTNVIKVFGEYIYKLSYRSNKRGASFRYFGGFGSTSNILPSAYSGSDDYMFDEWFIGRSETTGLWSQQMIEADGNLKVYNPYGKSTNYLTSVNVNIALPGKIPLSFFGDICTYKDAIKELKTSFILYDAGINIVVIRDIFNIYIPLLASDAILSGYSRAKYSFFDTIRFTLNLKKLNPLDFAKNAVSVL